jgi:hypothetical protein
MKRCGTCGSGCLHREKSGDVICLTCSDALKWMDSDYVRPRSCPTCVEGWRKLADGKLAKCTHEQNPRYLTEQTKETDDNA